VIDSYHEYAKKLFVIEPDGIQAALKKNLHEELMQYRDKRGGAREHLMHHGLIGVMNQYPEKLYFEELTEIFGRMTKKRIKDDYDKIKQGEIFSSSSIKGVTHKDLYREIKTKILLHAV
jgi:hypothetical protein